MKYATNFNRNFRHLKEVNEILLPYTGVGDNIVAFVEDNFKQKQRIIIVIDTYMDEENDEGDFVWVINKAIPQINMLIHEGWNIALKIPMANQFIELAKDNNIPFMFTKFATNLDMAEAQAREGVSDVYVTEELGFRIKDLQVIKEKYNINIRVFPNIAQSPRNDKFNGMQLFWIRPEDTELYEPFVDVFEILGGDDESRLSVIYEIYEQRQWLGNLNDIILDFKSPIVNNRGLTPHLGEVRINCGKKCLINKCNLCPQMAELADKFTEAGVEIIKKKYRPELTEEQKKEAIDKLKEMKDGGEFEFNSIEDINNPESATDI